MWAIDQLTYDSGNMNGEEGELHDGYIYSLRAGWVEIASELSDNEEDGEVECYKGNHFL